MAAASGLQRTLDIRVFNQAKGSRMSYAREYKLEVVISVPRDKSVLNCQTILSQHEDDRMLGSWCWVSNARYRADFQLGSLDLVAPPDHVYFSTFASLVHRDRRAVALTLSAITMQVGVVNTS